MCFGEDYHSDEESELIPIDLTYSGGKMRRRPNIFKSIE